MRAAADRPDGSLPASKTAVLSIHLGKRALEQE